MVTCLIRKSGWFFPVEATYFLVRHQTKLNTAGGFLSAKCFHLETCLEIAGAFIIRKYLGMCQKCTSHMSLCFMVMQYFRTRVGKSYMHFAIVRLFDLSRMPRNELVKLNYCVVKRVVFFYISVVNFDQTAVDKTAILEELFILRRCVICLQFNDKYLCFGAICQVFKLLAEVLLLVAFVDVCINWVSCINRPGYKLGELMFVLHVETSCRMPVSLRKLPDRGATQHISTATP